MKKIIAGAVFLLLGALLAADPAVFYSQGAVPGGIGYVRVEGDSGTIGVHAEISAPSGKIVSKSDAFSFIPPESADSAWVCLLGIPSNLSPGNYSLHAAIDHLDGGKVLDFVFHVERREFKREEIPLNTDLTEIRSKPDPRKVEEAKLLRKLVGSFTPSAVFALEHHRIPVDEYRVSSFFGDRRTYVYANGKKAHAVHTGIDFAAPLGTPVYASAGGRVVFSGQWIVTGKTVILEHLPGVFGLYYHLDSSAVEAGDYVKKGGFLGTVGRTGLATGDHLHWEIRVGGISVDPNIFVSEGIIDKAVIFGNSRPTKIKQRG
jgi:murein DD-endopeptidase MepM/ murein hydrolase activator NlpD